MVFNSDGSDANNSSKLAFILSSTIFQLFMASPNPQNPTSPFPPPD